MCQWPHAAFGLLWRVPIPSSNPPYWPISAANSANFLAVPPQSVRSLPFHFGTFFCPSFVVPDAVELLPLFCSHPWPMHPGWHGQPPHLTINQINGKLFKIFTFSWVGAARSTRFGSSISHYFDEFGMFFLFNTINRLNKMRDYESGQIGQQIDRKAQMLLEGQFLPLFLFPLVRRIMCLWLGQGGILFNQLHPFFPFLLFLLYSIPYSPFSRCLKSFIGFIHFPSNPYFPLPPTTNHKGDEWIDMD